MSSTDTETTESEVQTTDNEVQAQANELAELSIDQLKELHKQYSDQGNATAANAIQGVVDEREKLNAQAGKVKAKKEKAAPKSRKGNRAPKGRQVEAAKSFNSDPDQKARLKLILEGDPNHDPPIEPVIQPDGSYEMTAWLIQLGISGYYDERRREGGGAEAAAKPATAPIIPDATPPVAAPAEPTGEVAAGTSDAAAEALITDAPATSVANAEVAEADMVEDPLPAGAAEPQTAPGFPQNPYGSEVDDNSTPDE